MYHLVGDISWKTILLKSLNYVYYVDEGIGPTMDLAAGWL